MFTDNTDEENINYYGENKATTAEPQDNYIIVHYNLFNFRLCEALPDGKPVEVEYPDGPEFDFLKNLH